MSMDWDSDRWGKPGSNVHTTTSGVPSKRHEDDGGES